MFDMEVDEWVGPVQWSAQMISLTLRPQGRSIEKDKVEDIEVDEDTFNNYINPQCWCELWQDHTIATQGRQGLT